MENRCFDLHPYHRCGNKNHSYKKYSKVEKNTRLQVHMGGLIIGSGHQQLRNYISITAEFTHE